MSSDSNARRRALLDRLRGKRGKRTADGESWEECCPAHDDDKPSCTVTLTPAGKILLHCHHGCQPEDVAAGYGLEMADLAAPQPATNGRHEPERVYPYTDEKGELLFEVVRTRDETGKKKFWQRRPDPSNPGRRIGGLDEVRRVLYRIVDLLKSPADAPVFITEGEKDADRLITLGLVATTNPMGGAPNKWRPEFTKWLAEHLPDRHFLIIPDEDAVGHAHAEAVKDALRAAGLNACIVHLPGLEYRDKGGLDVSDWLSRGGSAERLLGLADEAEVAELPARRWRTVGEMLSRPKPEWRVAGILPESANAVVYGGSGIGKTFCVIDLTFHVALGRSWHDHEVKQGTVAYLAAEGGYELGIRMQAWMDANEAKGNVPFYVFEDAVNFLNAGSVSSFIADLQSLPERPALLVVDTLALCLIGGDENSPRDMGLYNEACRRIRREVGCQIVTVHHTGRSGDHERGHTSLRAANDTMIEVSSEAGIITLACTKQRNSSRFDPMSFSLIAQGDSCILGRPGLATGNLSRADREILEALLDCQGYLPRQDLEKIAGLNNDTALTRKLRAMVAANLIEREGAARSKLGGYRLTYNGRELAAKLQTAGMTNTTEMTDTAPKNGSRACDVGHFGVTEMIQSAPGEGVEGCLPSEVLVTSWSRPNDRDDRPRQARNGAEVVDVGHLLRSRSTRSDQEREPSSRSRSLGHPLYKGDQGDRDREDPVLTELEEGEV